MVVGVIGNGIDCLGIVCRVSDKGRKLRKEYFFG